MSCLVFHHVGLLTGQPEVACARLQMLGYDCGEPVYDPLQDVVLCMCDGPAGAPRMELVTPRPSNLSLSRLLRRKDDYGYHVCYSSPSISEGLAALGDDTLGRIVEVMAPKPAILFGGARVAFFSVPGLGLVELLEQGSAAP